MSEFISGVVPALRSQICTLQANVTRLERELKLSRDEVAQLKKSIKKSPQIETEGLPMPSHTVIG